MLVQVTVSPTCTVVVLGVKRKSTMLTPGAVAAGAGVRIGCETARVRTRAAEVVRERRLGCGRAARGCSGRRAGPGLARLPTMSTRLLWCFTPSAVARTDRWWAPGSENVA